MKSNEIGRIGEELVESIFQNLDRKPRVDGKIPDFAGGNFWIDSKVAYGSLSRFLNDYERQFKHYMKLFDKGVVVYWRGYSTVAYWAAMQRGIRLLSGWELERVLKGRGLKEKFQKILCPDRN